MHSQMLYPQFLFALMHVAEKRKSGFQEVVSRILAHNSAKPLASSADYIVYKNTGDPRQLREYVERPRGLPQLPVDNSAATKRMAREAEMAKSLGQMFRKPNAPAPNEGTVLQATASDAAAFGEADGLVIKPGTDGQPTTTVSGRMVMGGAMPDLLTKSMFLRDPPNIESELVDTETRQKWGLEPPLVVLPRRGPAAFSHPESLLEVRALSPDVLMVELKSVFERFNLWEHGYSKSNMDKIRFHKIMRDAALMTEQVGGLTVEFIDSVFFKVLPPSQDSFNFLKFVDTLRYVATKLRTSLNVVVERLVLLGGPVVNGEVHLPDGVHRVHPAQTY
uniref:Uncharacterized protein n=1 Tax=Chlamydomonas euryale TaxID=1486919 RepID=A0A7R9Z6E0_9CHLO|mmetsp:Transcript_5681/g.17340  ORF Transcript_5681/g.17340 Transcript_5681/m.17340 type:complete len:334 (+) Transcript_5681:391-1392(+)